MVKERYVIRLQPVSNIKELLNRIFFRKRKFVDYAYVILEYSRNGLNISEIDKLSKNLGISIDDLEYIIEKLIEVGMLEKIDNKLILSKKFSSILETMIKVWNEFVNKKHFE